VIMTVIVLNLHHRSPELYEMPDWVSLLYVSAVFLKMSAAC